MTTKQEYLNAFFKAYLQLKKIYLENPEFKDDATEEDNLLYKKAESLESKLALSEKQNDISEKILYKKSESIDEPSEKIIIFDPAPELKKMITDSDLPLEIKNELLIRIDKVSSFTALSEALLMDEIKILKDFLKIDASVKSQQQWLISEIVAILRKNKFTQLKKEQLYEIHKQSTEIGLGTQFVYNLSLIPPQKTFRKDVFVFEYEPFRMDIKLVIDKDFTVKYQGDLNKHLQDAFIKFGQQQITNRFDQDKSTITGIALRGASIGAPLLQSHWGNLVLRADIVSIETQYKDLLKSMKPTPSVGNPITLAALVVEAQFDIEKLLVEIIQLMNIYKDAKDVFNIQKCVISASGTLCQVRLDWKEVLKKMASKADVTNKKVEMQDAANLPDDEKKAMQEMLEKRNDALKNADDIIDDIKLNNRTDLGKHAAKNFKENISNMDEILKGRLKSKGAQELGEKAIKEVGEHFLFWLVKKAGSIVAKVVCPVVAVITTIMDVYDIIKGINDYFTSPGLIIMNSINTEGIIDTPSYLEEEGKTPPKKDPPPPVNNRYGRGPDKNEIIRPSNK